MTRSTHTEWRIECRKPGKRTWEFVPFTGATALSEERIRDRMADLPNEMSEPGWTFRVASREVTITSTDWEEQS